MFHHPDSILSFKLGKQLSETPSDITNTPGCSISIMITTNHASAQPQTIR